MTEKKSDDKHVSLAREEYDAFIAREESYAQMSSDLARSRMLLSDLRQLCDAQVRQLAERDLKTRNLERITSLQQLLIEAMRDDTKLASFEDMSEFWRQWLIHTKKAVVDRKASNDDVSRFEPDLFRSWRSWVSADGRVDRSFSQSGTLALTSDPESGESRPGTAALMQEHLIARLRQDNAKLAETIRQQESELGQIRVKQKV